ncbi:hypothetical protein V495_08376, partial [Pseudogymnoascus sp. VKM F-4514 (FW-929)]
HWSSSVWFRIWSRLTGRIVAERG